MAPRGCEKVPTPEGRGAHSLDYEHQVHLCMRTARTEASARASVLILHAHPAPRQVCLADGSDILGRNDGVAGILKMPRNYFGPEAGDAIRQQAMRYTRFRRPYQSVDEYIAEYDLPRKKAESIMEMGAGFPGQFVSILRMDNAALSRREKSLVMASCHDSLRFEGASASTRELFGSRGGGRRQGALLVEEAV